MCGIVGAVSTRNIVPILVEGLKRLEYRGYDSCGVAVHQNGQLRRARSTARVAELEANVATDGIESGTGIAHTRWATHGAPVVRNAHPHFSRGPGVSDAAFAPGPAEKCGCALCTTGAPCVAQRVWAMPVPPCTCSALTLASSSATREVLRARRSSPSWWTATPQES